MVRTASSILGLILLAGCAARPAGGPDACAPAPQPRATHEDHATYTIEDRQRIERLVAESTKLIKAGRTVKVASLVTQLKTPRCRVSLAAPQELAPEAMYDELKHGVVVIAGIYLCGKCDKWHASPASGFVIGPKGECVTNYHVVNSAGRETLVAMTFDGEVLPIRSVLAASRADDLAIVQVDLPAGKSLKPLALAPKAPVGSRVWVLSHPDTRFYSLTDGIISRYFTMHVDGADRAMMAITADYAKGSSGAPLLNDRGGVIGLVCSTNTIFYNITANGQKDNPQMVIKQCVPVENLRKLLE